MNIKEDVRFVKPILSAVTNVLTRMATTEATAGKPFVRKEAVASGDVTGVIDISGARHGFLAVSFTTECALAVVTKMFGEPITELGDDVKDAVGEITNMVSGQARQGLQLIGQEFIAGIPSILPGKALPEQGSAEWLVVPFQTQDGTFTVEISLVASS